MLTIDMAPGEPPLAVTLAELMQAFRVPGFSIAVVKDNRIAFSAGFGVTEAGGTAPVAPATLFQAASISKPVTAMGALWLVERGKLSLDADINTQLKRWKLPESPLAASKKVSLRRLMSHNAGLNVHGFAGYARGTPVPSIEQILDGSPPSNSPAVRVIAEPGSKCLYSGGGVTIEGLMIRDAAGRPFEDFMAERVLRPAGMTSSSFAQTLPPELAARAASGTGPDGTVTPGKSHVYPELAPDGLWTTAEDLARLGIEVSLSREGKANHILSQAMTRKMLTPHCPDDPGKPGGIGLGFGVGYGGHPGQFRHSGANEGFQGLMFMDADKGWGIALLGNSDSFSSIYDRIVQVVGDAQGWQYPARPLRDGDLLLLVAARRGVDAALAQYDRTRGGKDDPSILNLLGYRLLRQNQVADAVRVFERNTLLYPKDANAWDSLGEAHARAGSREAAIRYYRRSLALDPANANAKRQLEALER
ncbi:MULTISPECIES: serine hydrolase [unclassified Sphingomonas]|nr:MULTISPECIES: serine hydrolase [unclassified Sphingomonas]